MRVTGATTPSFHESDPDIVSDITTTTRLTGRHDPTYVHGDAEPLNDDEEEYEEVVIIKRRRKKRDEIKSETDVKQDKKIETIPNQTSTTTTTSTTSTTQPSTEATSTVTETIPATSTSMTNVTPASTDAAATVSSSVAPSSTTSFSSRPSSQPSAQDAPFTSTYRYLFLRTFLIFSLFLLFQHLYDKYYWIPHHRPHQLPEHDIKMKQQIQEKLRSQMCPPGVECSYQLPDDYEFNWKKGEVYGQEPKESAIHHEHVMDPAVEAELQREMERYEREQITGEKRKYKKDKKWSKSQEKKEKKDKKGRKGRRGEVEDL